MQKFGESVDKASNETMKAGCLLSLFPICIFITILIIMMWK